MHAPVRLSVLASLALVAGLSAQTPQPFPRPQSPKPMPAPVTTPAPSAAPAPTPSPAVPAKTPQAAATSTIDPDHPTTEQLGIFLPAAAQFIASYDAGRGQRYYLFGTPQPFAEVVLAYRTALKDKGSLVFEQPATHTWEIGKFREESMGFPPGITVKDYTTGGSAGYPNPRRGEQPERFPTVIQVVPPPPGSPGRR